MEWISTNQHYPKLTLGDDDWFWSVPVLILSRWDSSCYVAALRYRGPTETRTIPRLNWISEELNFEPTDITYWMPLPKFPEDYATKHRAKGDLVFHDMDLSKECVMVK